MRRTGMCFRTASSVREGSTSKRSRDKVQGSRNSDFASESFLQKKKGDTNQPAARIATMNTDRVRAYLQVACAGLGFDIGEIWWSSNVEEGSSSALAQIGESKGIVWSVSCRRGD